MPSLDPADWGELRSLGHRMLDDMFDHLGGLRDGPVWQSMPQSLRRQLRIRLPREPSTAADVYERFRRLVLPYATGNLHPGFMGWVHGGGIAVGMLAELLAGGLNANLGGRDHAPIEVEREVIAWAAEMLGFPRDASGLLVTGTSIANLIGLLVARTGALGPSVRQRGVGNVRLTAYASAAAHGCISQAMEVAGLGRDALRLIPCDAAGRMRLAALRVAVTADRAAGRRPFLLVGSAGTVDTGAIDDLVGLAEFCRNESLWFHVDGAFGAIAMLAPALRPRLRGFEQAELGGVRFPQVGAGTVPMPAASWCAMPLSIWRHSLAMRPTCGMRSVVLAGAASGPAIGPDLSRGFRALKVWMTLQVYGADAIGAVVQQSCDVAQLLAARVDREPELERLAAVGLNIVCFRYIAQSTDADGLNAAIVADVQEAGIAAPSTTMIRGRLAIRAAIVNHRTEAIDVDRLVDAVLAAGRSRIAKAA